MEVPPESPRPGRTHMSWRLCLGFRVWAFGVWGFRLGALGFRFGGGGGGFLDFWRKGFRA